MKNVRQKQSRPENEKAGAFCLSLKLAKNLANKTKRNEQTIQTYAIGDKTGDLCSNKLQNISRCSIRMER